MKSLLVLILSLSFIGCANYKSLDDVYFNQEADQIVSNQENLQLFTGKLKIKIDDEKFVLDIKNGVNFTENMTLNLSQVEESCEDGNGPLLIKGTGLPFTGDLIIINEGIDTFLKLYSLESYLPIKIITESNFSFDRTYNPKKYKFIDYLNTPYFDDYQEEVELYEMSYEEAILYENKLYEEFKDSQRFNELEIELNMETEDNLEEDITGDLEAGPILVRPLSNGFFMDKLGDMQRFNPEIIADVSLIDGFHSLYFDDFEKYIINYDNGVLTGEMQEYNFKKLIKEVELMSLEDFLVYTKKSPTDYPNENLQSNHLIKKEYWSNGTIKSLISYKINENTLNGPVLAYSKKGTLRAEASFLDNELIGHSKIYDDLGTIDEVAFYEDGRTSLIHYYYPNGQIRETISYVDSSYARTESKYYPNGQLLYSLIYDTEDNLSNKEFKVYYENGNLKLSMQENNGLIDGIVEEYYANGQIKSTTNYKDGLVAGKWSFWKKDGSILDDGEVKNGTGLYTYYDFENDMAHSLAYENYNIISLAILDYHDELDEFEIIDGILSSKKSSDEDDVIDEDDDFDEDSLSQKLEMEHFIRMISYNDFPFDGSFPELINFYIDEIITSDWEKDSDETSY